MVVAAHVRTPQLLNQDPNDADEQDEVHLGDGGGNKKLSEARQPTRGDSVIAVLDVFPPTEDLMLICCRGFV